MKEYNVLHSNSKKSALDDSLASHLALSVVAVLSVISFLLNSAS